MRIGVVAYEMEGTPTGVGRYLEGILQGVAQSARHAHEWLLFFKGERFEHPLVDNPAFTALCDGRPAARPILWEQLRLPRLLARQRLDALFSPAYSLPRAPGLPSLCTMHDLSFEHLPREFDLKERWRRRLLARRAARSATRLLVDTHTIARDVERTYGVEPARIGVVPLAIGETFFADATATEDRERRARLGVTAPYLLFVGSILPRRRLDLVLGAFADVARRQPRLHLVLAGVNRLPEPRQLHRQIEATGVAERVVEIGYVDEEALPALYRGAELTYYLSTYEGFGLPPLESLAAGTPAIISAGQALDELWPGYPYCCPTLELADVIRMTRRALDDSDERRFVAAAGVERLRRLTWERSAQRFLAELDLVVSRTSSS